MKNMAAARKLFTLLGKRSFLQQAVDRVLPLLPVKNIFVITNETQLLAVRKQLPMIPKANLIAEPKGHHTCAAVALGAALVGVRSATGVMAVLPADHVIPDEKAIALLGLGLTAGIAFLLRRVT